MEGSVKIQSTCIWWRKHFKHWSVCSVRCTGKCIGCGVGHPPALEHETSSFQYHRYKIVFCYTSNINLKMKLSITPVILDRGSDQEGEKKIPKFAFEYLNGGCNENVNLHKNTEELRKVELQPFYLGKHAGSDMKTELFGHVYDAPFGISPVGLQGLMWPNAPEILARGFWT